MGDWALVQVAERGCGIFFLANILKLYWHGPGKTVPAGHVWTRRLGQMTSSGTFQPQPFCEKEFMG